MLQWLKQYFAGEPFRLRSPLSDVECKRRIEEISRAASLNPFDVDREPVATWKPLVGRNQIYAWYPRTRRSPWLRGEFWSDGVGTIIVGRTGANMMLLYMSGALAAYILYLAWAWRWPLAALFAIVVPIIVFALSRNSSNGGHLVDFIQEVLEAEDVQSRVGDPIHR